MEFYEKVKMWFLATGLSNLGWGAGFVGALLLGWSMAAGVCIGIFVHLNWTKIVEIYKGL